MSENQLIYVCYDGGPHVDEARFSVLSAIGRGGAAPSGYAIVVVTDDGEPFADLCVTVDGVPPEQWAAWIGPSNYTYAIKVGVFRRALRRTGCRAVMHARKGGVGRPIGLGDVRHKVVGTTCDLGTAGGPYVVTAETPMWNSGVLGLAAADAPLADEAAALAGAIFTGTGLRVAEQFAFGCVPGRRGTIAESRDVVYHYSPATLRKPFRARLPALTCAKRTKAAGKRRFKRRLKRRGLFAHDQGMSV